MTWLTAARQVVVDGHPSCVRMQPGDHRQGRQASRVGAAGAAWSLAVSALVKRRLSREVILDDLRLVATAKFRLKLLGVGAGFILSREPPGFRRRNDFEGSAHVYVDPGYTVPVMDNSDEDHCAISVGRSGEAAVSHRTMSKRTCA